jgi:hypothetical protein
MLFIGDDLYIIVFPPEKESVASRTLFRTILMYGFHCCVWIFAVKKIRDTQCGFKVSSAKAVAEVIKCALWRDSVANIRSPTY